MAIKSACVPTCPHCQTLSCLSLSPALSSFFLSLSRGLLSLSLCVSFSCAPKLLDRQRDFQSLLQLYFAPPALTIAHKTQTTAILFLSSCKNLLYCCCLFLPHFLLSCRPQFRRSACLRGPSPRISVLLGPVLVCFFLFVSSMCVCVRACCVYMCFFVSYT